MAATRTRTRRPVPDAACTRAPALVVVATVLAALTLSLGLAGCGDSAVTSPAAQIDQAKNAVAKAEILYIETGVRAYQAMNGRLPADASQATLGQFVSPWPTNPWTHGPMQLGAGKGDYSFAQTNGGFSLTVHLDGGDYSRP
jgi:hypothetical protein